ncbi:MAG: tryptophan synthase subunit alpha [Gammaproteobacteria bacterium]|nr:tryptophan synthase subunit alpha [Gammaproteobacteria bacterium]
MSRLAATFERLDKAGKTALIPYITAGDPQPAATVDFMHKLVAAGADVIELGVPFSDPMADGPVIQLACERALAHGMSLTKVLEQVGEFRQQNNQTPVVLMGYANPLEVMGYKPFAEQASKAGVDGMLVVDLPPEEAEDVLPHFLKNGIDPIFLLAPTSSEQRIKMICECASGYVYYVSLKGVTGAASLNVQQVKEKLQQIRQHTRLPIGVGFGVRDPETASQLGKVADAVVVGSAIVARIAEHADNIELGGNKIAELIANMRTAMDSVDWPVKTA